MAYLYFGNADLEELLKQAIVSQAEENKKLRQETALKASWLENKYSPLIYSSIPYLRKEYTF